MVERLKLKAKEQKGFTLIELLAVIVILGILAAIAIPAIGGIIEKSRNDAKVAEAISIIDGARIGFLELDLNAAAQPAGVVVNKTGTTVTSVVWTVDGTNNPLESNVSKVQDADGYVVTYDVANNIYSINGHDAETVSGIDSTTDTASTGFLTEAELTAAAK